MDATLPLLIIMGFFAAALGGCTWLAVHIRRRGLAGGAMSGALASYEEAFRVTAHESHLEIRAQAERTAPALSPDGPWGRSPGGSGAASAAEGRSYQRRPRRVRRGAGHWAARLRRGR
ncbi:hypothetical protein [Streptomyces monomycini]|uniref:hypothetical protein n=1 Tax=Streptomyces monomycini TaxID=371720 RepID=UPI00067D7FC4|nr:hypothetical protein [Streptomyces monomycini]